MLIPSPRTKALEYSLIVLELCIQDKAQADDERRNNNERYCLFTPESCDKCRYQRYTDDKRTCDDGSPILRYIFFLDLSSVVGMYCADISHYVHDSNDRDAHAYEKTHKLTDWHQANEQMLQLNEVLCRHRIFRLIQTDAYILAEAKQLTEMLLAEGDTLEMDTHDHEILRQICAYEDYLENPKKYGRIKNPEELSEKQREW